jgi:hypothetical protein
VGYSAAAWLGFGAALAGASGALTGLLFVAVSIKSDLITRSRTLAPRAAQTLTLFMISVLAGLLLVAPQPRTALGSELLVLALACGVILLILDRRATRGADGPGPDSRLAGYLDRYSPNLVTALLLGVAGVTDLVHAGGGLYWLIPASMASLIGGVVSAWLFLVKVNG